jgi:iron complex transport system ATP-binding protein
MKPVTSLASTSISSSAVLSVAPFEMKVSPRFQLEIKLPLDVRSGEWIVVLGSNGSGKTTFLNVLSGLSGFFPNTLSFVFLNQKPLTQHSLNELARQRAFLSQFESHNPLTVASTIRLSELPFPDVTTSQLNSTFNQLLVDFGLLELKDVTLAELSGGEYQRTHLARVFWQCELMQQITPAATPLLLLDEPLNHLDLKGQYQLIKKINQLKKAGGVIISSSHQLNLLSHCDRLFLFKQGHLLEDVSNTKQNSNPHLNQKLIDLFDLEKGSFDSLRSPFF